MKVIFKDPKNEEYFKELDKKWNKEFGSNAAFEGLTEQLTDEQKQWVLHRLVGSSWTWKRWFE